jgi:hypothetical protein
MSLKIAVLCIMILSFSLLFTGLVFAQLTDDTVVAEIDGENITLKEFREVAKEVAKTAKPRGEFDLNTEEKHQLLENIVVEKLLYKEAVNKKLTENPEVMRKTENAITSILIKHLVEQEVTSKVAIPTSREIVEYYEKNKADYTAPDKVKVDYLNVYKNTVAIPPRGNPEAAAKAPKPKRVEQKAENVASEIKKAILKGKDIDELINHYRSLDPDNTPWVDHKYTSLVTKGTLYTGSGFDDMLFNLKEGEVGSFEFADRIMIFKVLEKLPEELQPFKVVESDVLERLRQERWKTRFRDFVSVIKKSMKPSIHFDLIK